MTHNSNTEFQTDALEYRTADRERRIELEQKWGERASFFKSEDGTDTNDELTWLDIAY